MAVTAHHPSGDHTDRLPVTAGIEGAVADAVAALPALVPSAPADRYGVRELTAAWLADFAAHTRTAYFRDLAHYLAWCQRDGLDPLAARPTDIGRYRAGMDQPVSGHPPAPSTVHRRLSSLSSWYRYLVVNGSGAVATNPVAGVRRPRVDRDASTTVGLSAAQVRALLAIADEVADGRAAAVARSATVHRHARLRASLRDRALLRMLADLGLRIGEALALDVDALSHNRGRPTLRYLGKGGRPRERPLSAHVGHALDEYLNVRAATAGQPREHLSGPLFATSGGRLSEPAAFLTVRRLAHRAGIPAADRLSPHSLRHSFATNARELGIALEDVQDAMGHADPRTTRRYDRARHALERDPALRLGELYEHGGDPVVDTAAGR